MGESKIDLTDRLRREGRWAEASTFKDEVVKELRAKGVKAAEAREHAWEELAHNFPPLPAPELEPEPAPPDESAGVDPGAGLEVLPEWTTEDGAPPDLVRDIRWVYQQLENRKVRPEQAPSAGAWNLLQWARDYRSRFFEQLLPKSLAKSPEDEEGVKREKRRVEEIEGVLSKLHEGWEQDLAADTPKAIRENVNAMLDDWGRRFGLIIHVEAKSSLAAHVGRLVQESVDALAPA